MTGTILIVEDEILVGMMLRKKIEADGLAVCDIATSGKAALELALQHRPALLFMDVKLTGKWDGIEAAIRIRSHIDIPIIFFTGDPFDTQLQERSRPLKPVAILDKMGSFTDILATIRTVIPG